MFPYLKPNSLPPKEKSELPENSNNHNFIPLLIYSQNPNSLIFRKNTSNRFNVREISF